MPEVRILPSEDFCAEIHDQVKNGKGIVPLIGAGLSASAGIPTRPDLLAYLQRCVTMALGLGDEEVSIAKRWHPRRDPWPPMEGDGVEKARTGWTRLKDIMD